MVGKDENHVPGPAHYAVRKNLQSAPNGDGVEPTHTSPFASHTTRVGPPTTRTKLENPPPGSYEVAYSYEKTQSKGGTSSSKPRNQQAYLRQRSFLSHAPRFGKMNVYMP